MRVKGTQLLRCRSYVLVEILNKGKKRKRKTEGK
jgi:hypothetical protein